MSNLYATHPDNETLLRLLDDDLSASEKQQVDTHVEGCSVCQRELKDLREALSDYLQFHELVLKTALPPAPRPWDRLNMLAARTMRPQPRRARLFALVPSYWPWAFAAVIALFAVVRLAERTPEVKAAELLNKAAIAEKTAPALRRSIRVKSRKYQWDRPARVTQASVSTDAAEISQLLESAGYSSQDPLSASAYAHWHDRLAGKNDRVEDVAQTYVIHTTSAMSPISDASLTLRAADLHAIACTLRFGETDMVEMTELQDETLAAPASPSSVLPPAVRPTSSAELAAPASPGQELQVIAALHAIRADLGEPIDVRREGANVVVNLTGLDERRQIEVKAALAPLPVVQLQSGAPARNENKELPRRPALQVDTANPLLSELQAALPGNVSTTELADQLTDHTEILIEHVYALRGLARRFPADSTIHMAPSEIAILNGIVNDHDSAVAQSTAAIERLLKPILPPVGRVAQIPASTWQNLGEALLADSRELDQAVNAGSSGDVAERKLTAARALANIDQRLARLRAVLSQ